MLPENKSVPIVESRGLNIVLYGNPGAGKTFFATQLNNTLIINTDGNVKQITTPRVILTHSMIEYVGSKKTPVNRTGWEYFRSLVDQLCDTSKHPYKIVVIDLLEDVYDLCRIHYLKVLNVTHESDLAYAKAYNTIKTNFNAVIKNLTASPNLYVVFISHTRIVESKEYVNLGASARNKILGSVDMCLRLEAATDQTGKVERTLLYQPTKKDTEVFTRLTAKKAVTPATWADLIHNVTNKEK